jgi:hypothetical protein
VNENGVAELLAELATDVPLAFVATAVNVYAVSFVRPVTTSGLEDPVAVKFPGLDVTVNPVIEDPPVAFAENATDTCAFPPVTDVILGACGTVVAVTALLADDAEDVPSGPVDVTA